jgi:hypothetical protein
VYITGTSLQSIEIDNNRSLENFPMWKFASIGHMLGLQKNCSEKQEVLGRTNLPTFLTLFKKMSFALKPAFAPTQP